MKTHSLRCVSISFIAVLFATGAASAQSPASQNPEMQQRITELKAAMAQNRQALAQYTWLEQDTISLKGEVRRTEQFQVTLGPDGKPKKTPLNPQAQSAPEAAPSGRGGRLKQRIVEKKTEEYKEYGDQIRALIQQYVPPEKEAIEQARQKGNIHLSPEASGRYKLVINDYVKPGDNLTLVLDKTTKSLVSLSIATYLSDPKDAVTVSSQFGAIPGGPNHVTSQTINGVSKQLTIAIQNSNYQKT